MGGYLGLVISYDASVHHDVNLAGGATVVAVLGDSFGGLGQLITEGIQTFFPTNYLLGGVLSVVLAISVDVLLVWIEKRLTPWAHAKASR